ncbi:CUE domain containing protein [Achlya hypogyna]|uniref:CUE domain containing protein n=1 Tax=Achlya hypogyna TaxID=1202772 RepID=A0A1V9YF13_ACHHY|nr:CUE domain containing protein [Achlya hypogyna]
MTTSAGTTGPYSPLYLQQKYGTPFSPQTAAVAALARDAQAKEWAHSIGLDITNVSWEDCARYYNCAWGPCISNMTLVVEGQWMPVLRAPNFDDQIMKMDTDKIFVTVGNESRDEVAPLRRISLQEYLVNIKVYAGIDNMYAPMQDHEAVVGVVATQASFLPLDNAPAGFHVGLLNYASKPADPAVLVLRNAILYCNDRGTKRTFMAERLSVDRANRGMATTGAMTADEAARNYVMIVQIPLLQKPKPLHKFTYGTADKSAQSAKVARHAEAFRPCLDGFVASSGSGQPDMEAAIVLPGQSHGRFPKLSKFSRLTRDPRYPIRVTVQFYQATSNGVMSPEIIHELANKMDEVKTNASWWGSLVTPSMLGTPAGPFGPPPAPTISFPPPVNPHEGVFCDVCHQAIATPERFKCLCCPNFNACGRCVDSASFSHPATHPLLRLTKATAAYGPRNYVVQNREACRHNVSCSACQRPVVGILYQCTHCPRVRLCEACELLTGHADFAHPMVKVYGLQ